MSSSGACSPAAAAERLEPRPRGCRRQLQVLGQPDRVAGDRRHGLGPMLPAHPVGLAVVQLRRQPGAGRVGMAGHPRVDRLLQDLRRLALVQDREIVREPHQRRPFAHDIVRQAVQRAHAIADARQQAALPHELGHAPREVVHGRVDQGDDQHLLVVGQRAAGHQPRRQRGEGLGLAAPRHRRDPHLPARVGEHFSLLGSWCEHGRFLIFDF